MKTFTKIVTAFLVVIALNCALGGFALHELGNVGDTTKDIKDNWMPSVQSTLTMRNRLSGFRIDELQHILSSDPADMAKYEKRMDADMAGFHQAEATYQKLITEPEERRLYDEMKPMTDQYLALHQQILALSKKGDNQAATTLLRGESSRLRAELDDHMRKIVEINVAGAERTGKEADGIYTTASVSVLTGLAIVAVIGVVLATLFARSLIRQLGGEPSYAAEIADRIADGNLATEVQLSPGDTTSMLHAIGRMRQMLAGIVQDIKVSTESVATAAAQITQGNADLSSRTEQQAASLEETAASMSELTATVRQNLENARQANQIGTNAVGTVEVGSAAVDQLVTTVNRISDSSGKIADIITMIEGIAFQTNILALNAAVEAARAGEQGRGFAVVASEVRSLAQRSSAAAKEIKELIESSVESVSDGVRRADEVGRNMVEVKQAIRRVADLVGEITAASEEQSRGIEQVDTAVSQMDQVTQQNAALVEEAAAAAQSMHDQADKLKTSAAAFRL